MSERSRHIKVQCPRDPAHSEDPGRQGAKREAAQHRLVGNLSEVERPGRVSMDTCGFCSVTSGAEHAGVSTRLSESSPHTLLSSAFT
jgi:hypothetical protein